MSLPNTSAAQKEAFELRRDAESGVVVLSGIIKVSVRLYRA